MCVCCNRAAIACWCTAMFAFSVCCCFHRFHYSGWERQRDLIMYCSRVHTLHSVSVSISEFRPINFLLIAFKISILQYGKQSEYVSDDNECPYIIRIKRIKIIHMRSGRAHNSFALRNNFIFGCSSVSFQTVIGRFNLCVLYYIVRTMYTSKWFMLEKWILFQPKFGKKAIFSMRG